MTKFTRIFLAATLVLASAAAAAAPMVGGKGGNGNGNGNGSGGGGGGSSAPVACTASNWAITGAMQSSQYTSGSSIPSVGPITATSCAGVFSGNEGPQLNPSPNLGYAGDGLLNGGGGLLSPTQFIDPSQLLALKDPTQAVDPGWIMLGTLGGNAGELTYASVTPEGGKPFNLDDVLDYTQTQTSTVGGTWTLSIDPNIIAIFQANNLFSRSSFDHLAFSVKSGKGWAVYDFDFNKMGNQFDLGVPYTLTGTWNMGDFMNPNGNNQQDISHISVWARDPIITAQNEVPEPAAPALFGAGLMALVALRRRRR